MHRPPPMLASQFPEHTKPLSRILVAAPRCYAFLTNFPFFSLHMKVCWQHTPVHALNKAALHVS